MKKNEPFKFKFDELSQKHSGLSVTFENMSVRDIFFKHHQRKIDFSFGFSIANAGDLNNDGLADVVIGAPYDGNGKVFVYMGKKSEMVESPDQILSAEDLPFKGIKYVSNHSISF